MHADPEVPDLAPGEGATIWGAITFFEGKLSDFAWQAEPGAARGALR